MKSLRIAGLCLVAMCMMSMVASGTASASPVWLLCAEKAASATKYETDQCEKASGTGSWAWQEEKGTEALRIVAETLRLEDAKTPAGKSTIQCGQVEEAEETAGSIGPGNKARITEFKAKNAKSECERIEGGCKAGEVEEVKGAHLPWQTELFETEGGAQSQLVGTGGEPGWEVTCNTILGKRTDTCSQEKGRPPTVSYILLRRSGIFPLTTLLPLGVFLPDAKLDCSEGGKESGLFSDHTSLLRRNSDGLRVI